MLPHPGIPIAGTNFESKRKNGPFRIKGDEPDDGRRETADSGRSKLRNSRRIEFLRTTTALGIVTAEKKFRRIKGYRHMGALVHAVRSKEKSLDSDEVAA